MDATDYARHTARVQMLTAEGREPARGYTLRALLFTAYIVIVSFIDTMAQLPILAPFLRSLGAGTVYTGAILGSYSLINMAGNLGAGPLVDAWGRKRSILLGLTIAGTAVAGYAFVPGPTHLLGLRFVHGLGGAILIPAVYAWAGDRAAGGKSVPLGRSMGYVGAAVAAAATIGPALGGIGAALLGTRSVFLLLGIVLGFTAALFAVVQPADTTSDPRRAGASSADGAGNHTPRTTNLQHVNGTYQGRPRRAALVEYLRNSLALALGNAQLRYTFRCTLGLTFALGAFTYAFPLTMATRGYSAASTGAFLSIYSLSAIALLVLPTNRALDYWRHGTIITTGSVFAIAALLALSLPDGERWLLAGAMAVYGAGFALVFAATSALVVTATVPEHRGTAFGVYHAVYSLGVFAGPIAAGALDGAGITPYAAAILVLGLLTAPIKIR